MLLRNKQVRGPDNAKDIWILGAGFSRQIYNGMPLMSDLAESVREIISERFDNPLMIKDVELALSELRDEAPWKSPADKHEDLALYEMVVERIQRELQIPPHGVKQAEQDSIDLGKRLVNTWHINRNHVITFNYDLVIESLLDSVQCRSFRDDDKEGVIFCHPGVVYPIPIPHVRTRTGRSFSLPSQEITLSYYKLHGSLNYHTYREPFRNTNIYYKHHNEAEYLAEGLQTFIVPPTDGKQVFIEHPVLHAIWTKAAEELANVDRGRIIIVGYSMPQTDLTVLSMLRSTIRSSYIDGVVKPEILVVNPDPDAARRTKELLGVPNPVGQVTDVTAFLNQYAPVEFVRTHVWNNRHREDTMKEMQIYRERGGELSEDDFRLITELQDEARESGRLGWEWFLSKEEFQNWWLSVHQLVPVNCWL